MSTILDALRKSERARRAGQSPAYGNASEPATPALLRWSTISAGVALLIALATFLWLMQRRPPPEIVAETVPPANPAAASTPVVPVSPAPATAPAKPDTRPEVVVSQPVTAPPPVLPPAKRPPATTASATKTVPLWASLPETERAGLPPLRVNIHVYTPDETQRILYINNEPRVRGEEVVPGVVVDEIVPEGAIVRYRGQRYLLPRPT